jgi:endo-1,4-beta-xylanase
MGLAALLLLPVAARAQLAMQHDFEDGTLQGWVPRGGGVVLTNTTEAANTGLRSLKTTGRTAGFHGPSRDFLGALQKDVVYQVRVSVRLVTGQPASTVRVTMQRTPAGGSNQFDTIASSATNGITDAAWVTLQGSYRFTTDVTGLLLYVESSDATSQYYIDDFRLTEVVPDQSGFLCDFETDRNGGLFCFTAQDGGDRNWAGRGSAVVTNVTEDFHGGSRSLKTTGRTAVWNGPALNGLSKMTRGFRYRVTVWAKLAPGEAGTNLRVSIERRLGGLTNFTTVIGDTLVTANQWVKLSNLFTMPADVDFLSFYVEAPNSATAAFYIDDVEILFAPPPPIQTDIPSLKDVLAGDFPIGAAVEPTETTDLRHADLARKHFSSLTAGNAMKFGPIHSAEATYNFAGADTIAAFARSNGMVMRGHTLVWHQQNPDWLFRDAANVDLTPTPENKALMLQRLESHIRAVVPRYDDVVGTWDVVNEVIDPNQADGLRRTRWYELTGTDYIDTAFRIAREVAKPEARLCINDYSTTDAAKRQALLTVVQGLLARGVPVDCVGHQMHVNVEAPSVASLTQTVETFAALGLDNQITEMDISVYTNSTDSFPTIPETLLIQQAYRYRDFFREFRRLKDRISSVTVWGLADDNTWLKSFPIRRLDLPLFFDEDLQAKLAYWAVVDPLSLPVLTQRRNVVEGTPRIDFREDAVWGTTGATLVGGDEVVSVRFKTLWDASHVYVLAEVHDPIWDLNDRVEVFVDENNGKTTTYEADDAAYSFKRFASFAGGRSPLRVTPLRDGYRVEAALPVSRALAIGSEVGFDLRVTDARTGTVVAWNDFTLDQDTDTSKFGTLALVRGNQVAEAVQGTPIVDGIEDALWAGADEITTGTWVLGTSGATASVKTMWDAGHLYVLAKVSDPLLSKASANPWEQDSVEVFVDQNNGKTASYEADDGQYRVNYENTRSFGGAASAAKIVSATQLVEGGYVVEAAIAIDAVEARAGTLLGFDVQVNDDGAGNGVRSSVATWNDPTGDSFRNTSRLGVLRLVRRLRPQ